MPAAVTWCSCMAWSSAAWVLGGVRLISSASSTLANTGPGTNRKPRFPVAGSSSTSSVPVISPGIRSGVNCTRLNERCERLGDGRNEERLGEPGDPDEERMTAGEERGEHPGNHLVLAYDPLGDLLPERTDRGCQAVQLG